MTCTPFAGIGNGHKPVCAACSEEFRFLQGATEMRDRVVFILMTGTKFHYRSARLHGFRLEMKLTEDDMPTPDDAG